MVLRDREDVVTVAPFDGGLMLYKLRYPQEIRSMAEVPDLNAAYEQLKAKGVRFTMVPTKQPWGGFMATFADPDGNVFYLDELRGE